MSKKIIFCMIVHIVFNYAQEKILSLPNELLYKIMELDTSNPLYAKRCALLEYAQKHEFTEETLAQDILDAKDSILLMNNYTILLKNMVNLPAINKTMYKKLSPLYLEFISIRHIYADLALNKSLETVKELKVKKSINVNQLVRWCNENANEYPLLIKWIACLPYKEYNVLNNHLPTVLSLPDFLIQEEGEANFLYWYAYTIFSILNKIMAANKGDIVFSTFEQLKRIPN